MSIERAAKPQPKRDWIAEAKKLGTYRLVPHEFLSNVYRIQRLVRAPGWLHAGYMLWQSEDLFDAGREPLDVEWVAKTIVRAHEEAVIAEAREVIYL